MFDGLNACFSTPRCDAQTKDGNHASPELSVKGNIVEGPQLKPYTVEKRITKYSPDQGSWLARGREQNLRTAPIRGIKEKNAFLLTPW